MTDKITQLLNLYISDERLSFMEPRVSGEFVFATDTHNAIIIDKDIVNDADKLKSYDEDKFIHALSTIPNCNYIISLLDIEEAFAKIPITDEYLEEGGTTECPECNGEGEVIWEYLAETDIHTYSREYPCPVCDGTGYADPPIKRKTGNKIPNPDAAILLCGIHISVKTLELMRKTMQLLSLSQARITTIQNKKASCIIYTDSIRAVFMNIINVDPFLEIPRLNAAKA